MQYMLIIGGGRKCHALTAGEQDFWETEISLAALVMVINPDEKSFANLISEISCILKVSELGLSVKIIALYCICLVLLAAHEISLKL